MIIFYITKLIAIRPPLLILHFKNFLNMKIQSLATLHVKPKHIEESVVAKVMVLDLFLALLFRLKKKKGKEEGKG